VTTITSLHNERVKLVRALQSQPKTRRKANRAVLEGARLVGDAVAAGAVPDFVLITPDTGAPDSPAFSILEGLRARGVPVLLVAPEIMAHAADTQTPQGILAVVPTPRLALPDRLLLALILDAIAEPGNLGTLLRTAAAAGADAVLLAPGCVDPLNPKALRAGMGAHFRVPVAEMGWPAINARCEGLTVYRAEADAPLLYSQVDWTAPAALVIGSEAHGLSEAARQLAPEGIAIPMANGAESLNAAAAAAVILFECRRQRDGSTAKGPAR
jgi:TrmH family RNA methyltransferase